MLKKRGTEGTSEEFSGVATSTPTTEATTPEDPRQVFKDAVRMVCADTIHAAAKCLGREGTIAVLSSPCMEQKTYDKTWLLTPLSWVIVATGRKEVLDTRRADAVTALLKLGADPNASTRVIMEGNILKTVPHKTLLVLALKDRHWLTATALVRGGADCNVCGATGHNTLQGDVRGGVLGNMCEPPLWVAAHHGQAELVGEMLRSGANANVINAKEDLWTRIRGPGWRNADQYTTPLYAAAQRGDAESVALLLNHGAAANAPRRGGGGGGATQFACSGRSPCCWHAEHMENYDPRPPLVAAAKNGHIEVVRLLLQAKARPNVTESQDGLAAGLAPLTYAVQGGHVKCVELLVRAGARLAWEAPPGDSMQQRRVVPSDSGLAVLSGIGWSMDGPLMLAAALGHAVMFGVMLDSPHVKRSRDTEAMRTLGTVASAELLMAGVVGGSARIVRRILGGERIWLTDDDHASLGDIDGCESPWEERDSTSLAPLARVTDTAQLHDAGIVTPLAAAIMHGHRELIHVLIDEYGATFAPHDDQHRIDPLSVAMDSAGNSPAMLEKLISAGAPVNGLAGACERTDVHVINGNPAPVSTPLHEATRKHSAECVRVLLEHGADVNLRDGLGETPLFGAAARHYTQTNTCEIIELLVAYGADVNATNNAGATPLWSMFSYKGARTPPGLMEIVALLPERRTGGEFSEGRFWSTGGGTEGETADYDVTVCQPAVRLMGFGADINITCPTEEKPDGQTLMSLLVECERDSVIGGSFINNDVEVAIEKSKITEEASRLVAQVKAHYERLRSPLGCHVKTGMWRRERARNRIIEARVIMHVIAMRCRAMDHTTTPDQVTAQLGTLSDLPECVLYRIATAVMPPGVADGIQKVEPSLWGVAPVQGGSGDVHFGPARPWRRPWPSCDVIPHPGNR